MKFGKMFCVLFLILLIGGAIADVTEFKLADFGRLTDVPIKLQILENQIRPINEAFNLSANLERIEQTAESEIETGAKFIETGIVTRIATKIPERGSDYEIIRNGETLNQRTTTIQAGDTLRITPQLDIADNWTVPGNDWIIPAGIIDSPPVIMLSHTEYFKLYDELRDEFLNRYPAAHGLPEDCPKFTAEKTQFNELQGQYITDNGYPAYITPILNRQKAGVQIFCQADFRENPSCKKTDQGIECEITESGTLPVLMFRQCFMYIDKIINEGEAIHAGWFSQYEASTGGGQQQNLEIQLIQSDETAPIADFDCRAFKENRRGHGAWPHIECDASKSYDPDGTIEKYFWYTLNNGTVLNQGKKKMKATVAAFRDQGHVGYKKTIVVELTVTDNDGITSTKTKNLEYDALPDELQPIPEFRIFATHNSSTGMTEITTECEGIVELDIENAIDGTTEIEKAEIPCGETTEIGPFNKKGAYTAIGSNNGETREAIFTVS